MGGSLADVFLSYAHSDKPKVQRLARRLEAGGFTVWWDPNLGGGVRFHKAIEAELRASKAVVVCWSKASVESNWVIDEASVGRDEQRLVPVSLDGSEPPLGFRQFQVLDFSAGGRGDGMSKLIEALDPLVKLGALVPDKARHRSLGWKLSGAPRRRLVVLVTVVAILGIGALLLARKVFFDRRPISRTVAVLAIDDLGGASQTTSIAKSAPRIITDLLGEYGEQVVPADASSGLIRPNVTTAAHDLNAGYVVDGDIRGAPDKSIVLALHLYDATGRPLWSHSFSAQAEEADYLPEQAATLLASLLSKKDQFNSPAFTFVDDSQKFRNERYLEAYTQAQRDLAAIPNSPSLMLNEAAMGALALAEIPMEQRGALVGRLRAEVERARGLDPSIDADWGLEALTPSTEWAARDELLAHWRAVHAPNSSALAATSLFLAQTGRVAEAVPLIEQSIAARPLSSLRLSLLGSSYFVAGRYQQARDSMAQARRRWPEQPSMPRTEFMADLLLGKTNEAARLLASPRLREQIDPPAAIQPAPLFVRAIQSRSSADAAAVAVSCRQKDRLASPMLSMCLVALNALGRTEDAFALTDQMFPDLSGITRGERQRKWLRDPRVVTDYGRTLFALATEPMRRDHRFVNLMNRLGLVEYWRSSGHWPEFCEKEPRSVCNELRGK